MREWPLADVLMKLENVTSLVECHELNVSSCSPATYALVKGSFNEWAVRTVLSSEV